MDSIYDVIIIGGGPAGLTAAIYTARVGLKTLILERDFLGGHLMEVPKIDNFPGFPQEISGADLGQRMKEQAEKFGAEMKFSEEVVDANLIETIKTIKTRSNVYNCYAVIFSTGAQRKKLLVDREADLLGRGVSYCPICDGPLFRGMVTALVGSGDEAIHDALILADIAKEVFVISSKESLEAAETLISKLGEKKNVHTLLNNRIEGIEGEANVKAVRVVDISSNLEKRIPVDGVFVSLGRVPLSIIVAKAGVEVDDRGCIKVDRTQRTNLEGVFAAGDCTCGGMQTVTAAGEGAMAAIGAAIYVRRRRKTRI